MRAAANHVMPHIIGTAGHIDHGKTSLLKALTGHDTDRLKEEKERGISIDLGFAYLDLPNGERVGIVDVPGHERFIRNMLAGAQGIDLVLFSVAADDGVMPQTEEHFDFLHLLGVQKGVFAITKVDMVDPHRIAEVHEEIEILTVDTIFEGAPILPVSSLTGEGMDRLQQEIAAQLESYTRPPLPGYFRLPVDRAFMLKGHGVVVTGTALAGSVREGDTVRVLPVDREARVRSLQVHGAPLSEAHWGQRVALNLVGLDKTDLARGHVVCHPKLSMTTTRFDARVEIRPGAGREVVNHERVRIHLGTAEALGKLIILDGHASDPGGRRHLAPKATALCQVVSQEPLVALRGDRFVLRNETAQDTLGGGRVIHPFARRHRRADTRLAAQLTALETPDLACACRAYIDACPQFGVPLNEMYHGVNAREEEIVPLLRGDPGVLPFPDAARPETYATLPKWRRLAAQVTALLTAFHARTPLAQGMEMESLRSQLAFALAPKIFRSMADRLVADGTLVRHDSLLRLPSHAVLLTPDEQTIAARLERLLQDGGLSPPGAKRLEEALGLVRPRLNDFLGVLEARHAVVKITPDFYLGAAALREAKDALLRHVAVHGEITAGAFRDLLGISRKTAIPLLEYFDRSGLTVRVGDRRKLRKTAAPGA